MAKIIAITNNKGGVGKTHTTFHLAGALSDAGERVLVVDLDPQANLTGLLLDEPPRVGTYDVLVEQVPLRRVARQTSVAGVDVVPADELLEDLGTQLHDAPDAQIRLDTAIRERQAEDGAYTAILFDCAPNLGIATRNALAAADSVVIPLEADKFSVEGLKRLLDAIEKMRLVNGRLAVEGVLVSLYNGRRAIEQAFAEALSEYPGLSVLPVRIKASSRYREAITARKPITHYKLKGEHADAFRELARIVIPAHREPAPVLNGIHAYADER
jgi:chromosome partitioning protein